VPHQHVTTTCLIPNTNNFSFIVAIYIQITHLSCDGASTRHIAVFCRILLYSTSHNILPNSASHILPSSTSYILPSSASHILPNSASYISPRHISYSLLTQPSTRIYRVFILTNVSSTLFKFAFIIISTRLS